MHASISLKIIQDYSPKTCTLNNFHSRSTPLSSHSDTEIDQLWLWMGSDIHFFFNAMKNSPWTVQEVSPLSLAFWQGDWPVWLLAWSDKIHFYLNDMKNSPWTNCTQEDVPICPALRRGRGLAPPSLGHLAPSPGFGGARGGPLPAASGSGGHDAGTEIGTGRPFLRRLFLPLLLLLLGHLHLFLLTLLLLRLTSGLPRKATDR